MAVGDCDHTVTGDAARSRATRIRGLDISSEKLSLNGRCDLVEADATGSLSVVEFKSTPLRQTTEVTEPMRVQLALQVAVRRDSGYTVSGQAIYFTQHKTRIPVELKAADIRAALAAADATCERCMPATLRPPLEGGPRYTRQSHISNRRAVAAPESAALHRGACMSPAAWRLSTCRGA